jgi:hypothetical protein
MVRSMRKFRRWALASLLLAAGLQPVAAQELSPRLYWPAPVGTQLLVLGYQHSDGDVLTDPSIPLYGVDSKIGTALAGYVRTFGLWGRTTNLLFELPYSRGSTSGLVGGENLRRDFAGFNDISVSATINLLGAPAMTREEFQALRADPHPILGLNLKLVLPTGYYEPNRLINVGANRWAARLQLGSILPLRPRWLLEFAAGAWMFGDDGDFIGGRRKQDPIYSAEAHLIHRFQPGFWLALDANYFKGGTQTVGGVEHVDQQENSRIGATLAVPLPGRSALKLVYSTGTRTRFGTDFNQFLVSYQRVLR